MKKKIFSIAGCLILLFAVTQVIRISFDNGFASTVAVAESSESSDSSIAPSSDPSTAPSSNPARSSGGVYQPITVSPQPENGTVFVDHRRAQKGERIEITLTPDEGYQVGSISVVDGKETEVTLTKTENGTYTFSMPTSRAYIRVTFIKGEGTDSGAETAPLYNDVKETDEYYEAIRYVTENGLMEGVSGGGFAPNNILSRAMLVTILYRLEGSPATELDRTFTDVTPGDIYEKPILWAKNNGIVNGYDETTFGPDDSVTRQQVATIMHRYAQFKGYDVSAGEETNILSYEDVSDVFEYAIAPYQYVLGSGIMKAKSEAFLRPNSYMTRAEFAEILKQFCEFNQ